MSRKRPALGRGLDALLPPAKTGQPPSPRPAEPSGRGVRTLPIEQLSPNPNQPRKDFPREALEGLAASVRAHGIIQPIVASPDPGSPGRYTIVAGERRWRAAQIAGVHDVPVVIRDTPDQDRLELAVVENLQRSDLNPIEEAHAFQQLIDLRECTQEQLAERLGKDRTTVTNALRLLRLPDRVQQLVRSGKLQMGHARALLGLAHEDQIADLATRVIREKLSVRATERAVREHNRGPQPPTDGENARRRIIITELESRLRRKLGARARVRPRNDDKGAGTLEVPYSSLDELDRILRIILDGPGD